MKNIRNKALKKYLHNAKKSYRGNFTSKRIFINQLTDSLISYAEQNKNCTYEDIVQQFGNPKMFSNSDYTQLYMTDSHKINFIKFTISIAFIFAGTILLVYTAKYFYSKYDDSHGYNIEISSSSKIQDNVNPKTQKKDPKAQKVYNFGTDYADDK